MPNHIRKPIVLFGTQSNPSLGGAVTAQSVGAGGNSQYGDIGTAQNITLFIRNDDASVDSVFKLQAAANTDGSPGGNYIPGSTDWFDLYDGATGLQIKFTVTHAVPMAFNVGNIAANYIRLSCASAISSCIAICEIAL